MKCLISIIVPVYNTEQYLRRCIDSVLAQTYQDFELLLKDDGSKDSSGTICDEYAAQDARVRVFHKENGGVSDTRNYGLDLAQGKYLMFLDADDFWLQDDVLEVLIGKAEEYDLDIIRGEYKGVDSLGKDLFIRDIDRDKLRYMEKTLDSSIFLDKIIHREFFLPLCLIKTSKLCGVRFNVNRIFLEDIEFFLYLLLKPIKCMYIPFRFYAYRKHEQSASNNFSVERLRDAFNMSRLYFHLSDNPLNGNMRSSFIKRGIDYYRLTLQTMAVNDRYYVNRHTLSEELNLKSLGNEVLSHFFFLIRNGRFECFLCSLGIIEYYRIRNYLRKIYLLIKMRIK